MITKEDLKRMEDLGLIEYFEEKYYSRCSKGEEITIEINKLMEDGK